MRFGYHETLDIISVCQQETDLRAKHPGPVTCGNVANLGFPHGPILVLSA
jgi:hypothetical protein